MAKGKFSAHVWQEWFSKIRFEKFTGEEVIIGVDCGKVAFYGAVMSGCWKVFDVVYFERNDIKKFIKTLKETFSQPITLVLEPTGTYSDPLINQARQAGFKVVRIEGSRVNKAATVFDGIPSLHDGKSAYLLARLYLCDVGKDWKQPTEEALDLRALVNIEQITNKTLQPFWGYLEAYTARHWPEITDHLSMPTITFLTLISTYGSAQNVTKNAEEAAEMMRRIGGHFLKQEKIDAVIQSAQNTIGEPPGTQATLGLKYMAGAALDLTRRQNEIRTELENAARLSPHTQPLVEFCGARTAAITVGILGPLTDYEHPKELEKACGLNLCEYSTGKTRQDKQQEQRGLHISKRGPKRVRSLLFFLAMRQINPKAPTAFCEVARAWYDARLARNGNNKMKALIALMRKLTSALWWISRGATYDPEKLYDIDNLKRQGFLQNYTASAA